jgi:hypothetical protein
MLNSKFCVRPFVHSLVETDGTFRPCCRAIPATDFVGRTDYNINVDTAEDWWNSPYMNYLRLNMLNNIASPECERCDRQESQGAVSFRRNSNREFGIVKTVDTTPRDWEFQISNLCNLKCMMCNSQNSSQLLNENVILFGDPDTQQQYTWSEQSHATIKQLLNGTMTSAVIRGGEPFMVPWVKQLLDELPDSRASELTLLFNTNLTKLNLDWIKTLKRFKHVKLSCSIDAVGNLNQYIRFPSKWNDIVQAVTLTKLLPNANVFINACVQNLNVLHLDQLLFWAKEQGIYVILDTLTEPDVFEVSNLPTKLVQLATWQLEKIKFKLDSNMIVGFDGVLKTLYNARYSESKWNEFQQLVNTRDQHRGVSVLAVNPEFTEYWNA